MQDVLNWATYGKQVLIYFALKLILLILKVVQNAESQAQSRPHVESVYTTHR